MKRWLWLILTLAGVGLCIFVVRHALERRAERKRETAYQLALRTYSEALKPGRSRKEVEDYLRTRNVRFLQMCCVETKSYSKGVYDDLVRIGQEQAPWFCSENNVYVAFQFINRGRTDTDKAAGANASDILTAVTIFHWLEGCL